MWCYLNLEPKEAREKYNLNTIILHQVISILLPVFVMLKKKITSKQAGEPKTELLQDAVDTRLVCDITFQSEAHPVDEKLPVA